MRWLPFSRHCGKDKHSRTATRQAAARIRLTVESLEDRTVPTLLFVDAAHFPNLAAAVAAATSGDIIQIEPNIAPGSASTGAKTLTIQGDPNFPPSFMTAVGTLTLQSSGNVVYNLNVNTVVIANGARGQAIINSLAANIAETPGPLANGGNVISGNTVTNTVTMGSGGAGFPGASNDVIINNVFVNSAGQTALLAVAHDNGAVIRGNSFNVTRPGIRGIQVDESSSVTVANNNILLTGLGSQGIVIDNPEFDSLVAVTNNRINTGGLGTGILTIKTPGHALSVLISGNDLVDNFIGIDAVGDGTALGTIDAGGGVLNSRGGNDFHGYVSTIGGRAAIKTGNASSGLVSAEFNIINIGVSPSAIIISNGGAVDFSGVLSADQAFVQDLYNDMLGRSGTIAELNGWVSLIPTLGQQGVATQIIHSSEASFRLVSRLYVKLLGREPSHAEISGAAGALAAGATEELVITNILGSSEFAAHAQIVALNPATLNSDFVQSLFILLLGRQGSNNEVNAWIGQVPIRGRATVASDFLSSIEFRSYAAESLYFTDPVFPPSSILDTLPNMLHRSVKPTFGEVVGWAGSPLDILSLEAVFAGSAEFYAMG